LLFLPLELLPPLAVQVRSLLAFVRVSIWDCFKVDVDRCEAGNLHPKNLLDARYFEQSKAVGALAHIEQQRTEDKSQLMLFIIPHERDERFLGFVNQISVRFHSRLHHASRIALCVIRVYTVFTQIHIFAIQKLDISAFWFI
jgi:hypothetical protein